MSSLTLNDENISTNLWLADTSGLWTLSTTNASRSISRRQFATTITARTGEDPPPFAGWAFDPPLALQERESSALGSRLFEELRFWFRSDRVADGSSDKPFYLAFEVTNSTGVLWQRLVPIKQKNVWELHSFWLADMPDTLKRSVQSFTLRSLDASVSFNAAMGDLIAVIPEPLQDVDATLLKELDQRFQVLVGGDLMPVRALVELPEIPGDRALPYILITPWAVQPQLERCGSGELIDNYTVDGAYFRPPLGTVQLDYSIDVFAQNRSQKTYLLEQILDNFNRAPYLIVSGDQWEILPFTPPSEEVSQFTTPGRTPLFYRLVIQVETGDRQLKPRASPYVLVGPLRLPPDLELVRV